MDHRTPKIAVQGEAPKIIGRSALTVQKNATLKDFDYGIGVDPNNLFKDSQVITEEEEKKEFSRV
jgi:hypothetical protein